MIESDQIPDAAKFLLDLGLNLELFKDTMMGLLLQRYQTSWNDLPSFTKQKLTSEFNIINMNTIKN